MSIKRTKIFISLLLTLVLILPLLAFPVYAATVSVLDGKLSVTGSISGSSLLGSGTTSVSGDIVTATAYGGRLSRETNTITITNNTDKAATISFSYSASNYSSFSLSSSSGTYALDLAPNETKEVMSIVGKKASSSATAKLTLSNFTYKAAAESSNVTFNYIGGTVTVAGTKVNSGDSISISSTAGGQLVASPASGYTFLGWINENTEKLLSEATTYTIYPTEDMTVKAVFTKSTDKPWFKVGDKYVDDLNKAVTLGSPVVLVSDGTLPAGNYTIPSSVTLLIPYDANHTVSTTNPGHSESYTNPTVYRKLTMAEGANITVEGKLCVNSLIFAAGGGQSAGAPTGKYGQIDMKSG